MSSGMAGANKEQAAGTRRNGMSEVGPAARRASRPTCTDTEERVAVWDAVAAYIREHLLVQKGVWIPTFGSFDTVSKDVRTEDETLTLRWPVFHLATNLIATHHLKACRESLPVHRKMEPLKYSKAAAAASLSWETLRTCIQSTVSLLSSCLKKGENVAVVLKDIGVLLIDGLTFQMKFFFDFLEKLSGKDTFRRAVFKAPWLLDTVVSQVAPVASMVLSGCAVVFPMFQMEFVPKPPPAINRRSSGSIHGQEKPKGKRVRFADTPTYIKRLSIDSVDGGHLRRIRSLLLKESSKASPLPPIRRASEAQKQPLTCQLQGEAVTASQQDLRRAPGTKHVSSPDEEQGAGKAHREGVTRKLQTAKGLAHHITLRPITSFIKDSRRSSSRAESTEPQDQPSRFRVACDSLKLLRQRARKIWPVQDALGQMAASPLRGESRLPEESSITRPGLLPPIKEETGSPECQPPKTKPSLCRKAAPYPR